MRQSLEQALAGSEIEIVSGHPTLSALIGSAYEPVDLLLVGWGYAQDPVDELPKFQAWQPEVRVVVLDHTAVDSRIHQVLRMGLNGYLTKEQPLYELRRALIAAARGERVFAPHVADRLIFTGDGIRLAGFKRSTPLAKLTPRELDVLLYIARGYTVKQCAKELKISASTVDNHKSHLMAKLKVHKAIELTHLAVREGLLSANPLPLSVDEAGDTTSVTDVSLN